MRLYTRTGASSVHNEDHGSFDVDPETGAIEVPDDLGLILHRTHIGGHAAWENDAEKHARLAADEVARRQDPATLLAAVEEIQAKLAAAAAPVVLEPIVVHHHGVSEPMVPVEHPADGTMSPPVSNEPAGLEALSVKQLRKHAAETGVQLGQARTKAQILAVLTS